MNDPVEWKSDNYHQEYIVRNGYVQNIDCNFSLSSRMYGNVNRFCSKTFFIKELENKDIVQRKWLVYSPKIGCLFCAPCRLFGSDTQFGSNEGFNDWKNVSERLTSHEQLKEHKTNILNFMSRQKLTGRIDQELIEQIENETKYWKEVLIRVIETIKFLASRGLALRGSNEKIYEQNNGNFLGALQLVARFDPFLANHIGRYGNAGKGIPTYLSKTIYEEIIIQIKHKMTNTIIEGIKHAKYYSIIIDSTPDIAHIDQLVFAIRYVQPNGVSVERFLLFIANVGHKAKDMAETVLNLLSEYEIPIEYCRGQSYDNAANMSGQYTGVQARIKNINQKAKYIPCSGHLLNLIGTCAAENCFNATNFFDLLQKLFNFFSCSTNRWSILEENIGKGKVVKNLSVTRWSARSDACNALYASYAGIKNALLYII